MGKIVIIRLANMDVDVKAMRQQLDQNFPSNPHDGEKFNLNNVVYRAQVRPQSDNSVSIDWIPAPKT